MNFYDSTLERELLGDALARQEVAKRIAAELTVDHFGSTENRLLFTIIKKLVDKGVDADLSAVTGQVRKHKLEIDKKYLVAIAACPRVNEAYHIGELRKLHLSRLTYQACTRATEQLEEDASKLSLVLDDLRLVTDAPPINGSHGFDPGTVQDLMGKTFAPARWAIEDLLPEGLTIFAGAPKMGKSFLSLDIGLAVSHGDKVLGDYQASKGQVLYAALEDSERRLQTRLTAIAEEEKTTGNTNFFYTTRIPGMAAGGLTVLEQWLTSHPDCRLVIIDTLAKFVPASEKGANAYHADYAVASSLQSFALKHEIALLMVHHVRKQKAEDVFDEVSGSNGYTGAADAVWVLKRNRTETYGTLTVTGRDIEENKFAAEFDRESHRWALLGDERQATRRKNLVALSEHFGTGDFTFDEARQPLQSSLAHAKRIIGELETGGYAIRGEKRGRAYTFRLTEKFADMVFGGS